MVSCSLPESHLNPWVKNFMVLLLLYIVLLQILPNKKNLKHPSALVSGKSDRERFCKKFMIKWYI